MSRSGLSSLFARSAFATQAAASATSLLCSAIGKSSIPDVNGTNRTDQKTASLVPWIDDLGNTISMMYVRRGAFSPGLRNSVVHFHPNATIENPIICYSGVDEIERAFRARATFDNEDNTAMLELVHVEASEDSIAAGVCKQNDKTKYSPPTIEVVYRLQKTYGSFFSMNTMLKVTVQYQNTDQNGKIIFHLPDRAKAGILATSGVTKNVLAGFNATSLIKYALTKDAWQRWFSNKMGSCVKSTLPASLKDTSFVAEIVKIEECWNEVELIQPFYLSRRINGLLLGSLTYLLNFIV